MRRLLFALLVLLPPILMVAIGGYFILTTVDVVTETIEYNHSHSGAFLLILFGGIFSIFSALMAGIEDRDA